MRSEVLLDDAEVLLPIVSFDVDVVVGDAPDGFAVGLDALAEGRGHD